MERKETEKYAERPPMALDTEKASDELELVPTKSLGSDVSFSRESLVVILISMANFHNPECSRANNEPDSHHLQPLRHHGRRHLKLVYRRIQLNSQHLHPLFGATRRYIWMEEDACTRLHLFCYMEYSSGLAWYSNHVLFICSRAFAVIGPAIVLPNGLALLGALYQPGKRKNMAFAVFGGCAPAGGVTGFVVAGLFNLVWWPWTFWFTGMALFVTALVAWFAVRRPIQLYRCFLLIILRYPTRKTKNQAFEASPSPPLLQRSIFSEQYQASQPSFS